MFVKRLALGIAAAAFAVTAIASPFASPAQAQVFFRPDVRVNYDQKFAYPTYVDFHFRVTNLAVQVSGVKLYRTCSYLQANGSLANSTVYLGTVNMQQDQVIYKTVHCPKSGVNALKAALEARVDDDLNPSNNKAWSTVP